MSAETKTIHEGRNIKRFREMMGMKQEALAMALGDDWNQKKVSLLEAKEAIEDSLLEQVAAVLKVPVEAIKNFDEEGAINIIANTFNSHDNSFAHQCTFNINPVEKWMEMLEENKKLYERLLKTEQEKVALLEKLLEKK
ncbi:MAG: helix-turn-helix transcriptional regulator [Lacibacter sp.]